MTQALSPLFNSQEWTPLDFNFSDITYHRHNELGLLRIAFNRPEVRNAFRPQTVDELLTAFEHARSLQDVGVIILTGNGPSPKDGGWAFCSGGDQQMRGKNGYMYDKKNESAEPTAPIASAPGRLHILEVQRLIRFMPKVVMAAIPGWTCGGGHSLHVVCDLSLASERALFKQTDAKVASFDAGLGSAYLARQVGQKKAREIFFLGKTYTAKEACDMGMVNKVTAHEDLEKEAIAWGRSILEKSPTAIYMLKYAFNAPDDGLIGQQLFAGEVTRMHYRSEEAQEGKNAFLQKRKAEFNPNSWPY